MDALAFTCCRINRQQIELGLRTVLALHYHAFAIWRPIDAGEIDVRLLAEIDLDLVAAICVHQKQLDNRIIRARDRIALFKNLGAGRANCSAGHNAHGAFIGALDDQSLAIRRPPIAVNPVHFLLGDKLRLAPTDRIFLFGSDRRGFPANLTCPQLAITHEGDIAAIRAQLGIELAFLRIGEARHTSVELSEVEVSIQWHHYARTVRIPLVRDDAFKVAYPRPLALHLLIFGKLASAGEFLAVDQHRPLAVLAVITPQIIALALVLAIAKHGEVAPIGR